MISQIFSYSDIPRPILCAMCIKVRIFEYMYWRADGYAAKIDYYYGNMIMPRIHHHDGM